MSCKTEMASNPWGYSRIMACTGRLRQKSGVHFQTSGPYERVGISLIEVYEMVAKSVFSVSKKAQKSYQMHFVAVKKSRKLSSFVIYSYLKYRGTFTAVKGMQRSKLGTVKFRK